MFSSPSILLSFPSALVCIATACLVASLLLYRAALPRPLPGIPYKKASARRLLGDFPDAFRHQKQHGDLFRYWDQLMRDLDSPVVQFFARPFGAGPWVLVSDFREAKDVLTRRTHEFDRSPFFADVFGSLLREHHVHMSTGLEWKAHRRLVNETMSNDFLHGVVAQEVEDTVGRLLRFWRAKVRLADGHPFDAKRDIQKELLETIWAATFGSDAGSTTAHLELLATLDAIPLQQSRDASAVFPEAKDPVAFTAIGRLLDSVEIPVQAPVFPGLIFKLALTFLPSLISAQKCKKEFITGRLREAGEVFARSDSTEKMDSRVKCALDLVVQREIAMAKKTNRPAAIYSQAIQDELLGFLMAGADTSAMAVLWCLKHLTVHQAVQACLRKALHDRFGDAGPSAMKLSHKDMEIPYLEAVIAETLRMATIICAHARVARVDTQILGYPIPKGTDVFFAINGPGFISPALSVDESKRSQTSQEDKVNNVSWTDAGINMFAPGRWIETRADGTQVYNPRAGPTMPFGAGPRSCFGRKLAHMSLKIHIAFIVWNFELQPLPEGLGSMKGIRLPEECYLRLRELRYDEI